MLTASEAAQALGVSKRTIYTLAAKGLLPCYRIGAADGELVERRPSRLRREFEAPTMGRLVA